MSERPAEQLEPEDWRLSQREETAPAELGSASVVSICSCERDAKPIVLLLGNFEEQPPVLP